MLKVKAAVCSVALALSSMAFTDESSYISANVGRMNITGDPSLKVSPGMAYVRFGKQYNHYFSAEARLGAGLADDTDMGITADIQNMYGVYGRLGTNVSDTIYPYLIVGYTQVTLETSFLGFSIEDKVDDVSYGVGVDIDINKNTLFNVEYISYLKKHGAESVGLAIGLTRKF